MPRLCSSHPSDKCSNSALAICDFLPLVRFSAPGVTCCTVILVSFFPYLKSRLRPNASPPSVIPGLAAPDFAHATGRSGRRPGPSPAAVEDLWHDILVDIFLS